MGAKSPYVITLSEEDRKALKALAARYSAPFREVIRAKIVLYAAQGMENTEIASRLDVDRQLVVHWRKRFFEEGVAGLEERQRSGRPPRFSPQRHGRGQGTGMRASVRKRRSSVRLERP